MTLLIEICKRFRQESVSLIEAHVDQRNEAALKLFQAVNFDADDQMLTFRRELGETS
jgi:L-amino acid N-acyltransferase YncA